MELRKGYFIVINVVFVTLVGLKVIFIDYLNEEIGRLKEKLQEAKETADPTMASKVSRVYEILDNTKNKPVDTETLEIVLQTQELLEEMEENDS